MTETVPLKERYQEDPEKDDKIKPNLFSSIFNLMNAILGSGILGLPFAMAQTGYVTFILVLGSVSYLAYFSIDSLRGVVDSRMSEQSR